MDNRRTKSAPKMIGQHPLFLEAMDVVRSVADTDCTVLVTGASGTGKELVARLLHDASARSKKPFVAINCAAISPSLVESELFGHVRGSFTGANTARQGCFVSANDGTVLLDEIGEMPMSAQAKLLRVLQDRQLTPVGSDRPVPVNVRIVAATNKDLEDMVRKGTFRADLYYRLCVIRVQLPALCDRASDIIPLAKYFLATASVRHGRSVIGMDESAEQALLQYRWPGNIRELANIVERSVILGRGLLSASDIRMPRVTEPGTVQLKVVSDNLDLKAATQQVERNLIKAALERAAGNRTEAAALLGLNRTTLVEKLRRFAA